MSDNTELKRAASEAKNWGGEVGEGRWYTAECFKRPYFSIPDAEFIAACEPGAVLALIAENEELGRYLCTCRDCGGEGALHTGDWHSYGHMEPPEPVMEKCGECDGTGLLGEIQDLYQVITDRDQLRAEVAGLRTDYEAYEQVNAELKAEVQELTDRASYWKQRAKSAEGHLCASDTKAAAIALQARTEFAGEDWDGLSGCQRAKLLSVAAIVIGAVNDRRDAREPGGDSGVIYG